MVETRLKEIERLEKQERLLCRCFGRTPKGLQATPLPSQKVIVAFENYLEELEREKFERMETFCARKTAILELVSEIGVKPDLDFEKTVIEKDDSEFLVTDENMEKLVQLHESLKNKLMEYNEEIDAVREKIEKLWNFLDIDIQERDLFRSKCVGNAMDKLSNLKEELRRCEALRSKNIEVYFKHGF